MDIKTKLTRLAEESLQNSSLFVVDVVTSSRNLSKITVIVDGDSGVTIEDCGKVSKALSIKLDEADFGTDRYVLEVATPGLDHPLKLNRQFIKNIGRGLKVHGKDKSILQGKLMAADEESMTLRQEIKVGKTITEKVVILRFEDVEKAFVLVSFK